MGKALALALSFAAMAPSMTPCVLFSTSALKTLEKSNCSVTVLVWPSHNLS